MVEEVVVVAYATEYIVGIGCLCVGAIIGAVCAYKYLHREVPSDCPELFDQVKSVDDQIRLAENHRRLKNDAAANAIFD